MFSPVHHMCHGIGRWMVFPEAPSDTHLEMDHKEDHVLIEPSYLDAPLPRIQ